MDLGSIKINNNLIVYPMIGFDIKIIKMLESELVNNISNFLITF